MIVSHEKTKQQTEWLKSIATQIEDNKNKKLFTKSSKSTAMVHKPNEVLINIPHLTGEEEVFELLDKHNKRDEHILIVDDIDFDGTGACYIVFRYLKEFYKASIDIQCNNKHGFEGERIKGLPRKYNLVIIVDSSTTLIDTYNDLDDTDILIIDHHEVPEDAQVRTVNSKGCTVVNCNSLMTPTTRCISAGMLCYLLMHKYYVNNLIQKSKQSSKQLCDDSLDDPLGVIVETDEIDTDTKKIDLYEVGAVTNISDIVPVDEFVRDVLIEYYLRHGNETTFIHNLQYKSTDLICKMNLQWNVIPLINYTRRLQDESTLNLLYRDNGKLARDYLRNNHSMGKAVTAQLESLAVLKKMNNFIYADISAQMNLLGDKITRFTGLLCNQLQNKYGKPCVVSVKIDEGIKVSVRSSLIDSLKYFMTQPDAVGGGHKTACGFVIETQEKLDSILSGYDNYLSDIVMDESVLIHVDGFKSIFDDNVLAVALYNELCFSNLMPLMYIMDKPNMKELHSVSDKVFRINDITAVSVNKVEPDKSLLVKPLYEPKVNGSVRLLIRSIDQ